MSVVCVNPFFLSLTQRKENLSTVSLLTLELWSLHKKT